MSDSLGLLKDHLKLAELEWEYEKEEGRRRLLALATGVGPAYNHLLRA